MIWHNSTAEEVLNELDSDIDTGLDPERVAARLKIYGKNEIRNSETKGIFSFISKRLLNFVNIALIVVCIIHEVLASTLEVPGAVNSYVIIAAVIVGAVISAVCDHRAQCDLSRLKSSIKFSATVIRDGREMTIDSRMLVPGDIMVLKTGDYIRADGRLIDSYALTCEEFRVTGEMAPFEKNHEPLFEDITPISKRQNMVYSGTVVSGGKGLAVVTETGLHTELGMRGDIKQQLDTEEIGVGIRLAKTRKSTNITVAVVALIIFFASVIANFSADVSFAYTVTSGLLLALTVFVSAYSDNITSMQHLSAAFTAKRLHKEGIYVTDPAVAESLKDITAVCTDKTGILTTEDLTVVKIYNGKKVTDLNERDCDEASQAILRLALICSNFSHSEHAERHTNNMERAIEAACIKHSGMSKIDVDGIFPKLGEIPFDSERMLMTTVTAANGNPVAIVKGAPEIVLARCDGLDTEETEKIANDFAKEGLKVICVAIKNLSEIPANPTSEELEFGLTFAGIIGFEDEADPKAAAYCRDCTENGIKVLMLTGDHIETAAAIGKKLGIIDDESAVISGDALAEIDDSQLPSVINDYAVFARISPEDKLRIVRALKANKEKVLVTGDSINDAQALLEADIGCALGHTASDMVKDCADMVIDDNRFSSIMTAIKESGRLYLNIKKALAHHLSVLCTVTAVVLVGLLVFGLSPLSAPAVSVLTCLMLIFPGFAIFADRNKYECTLAETSSRIFGRRFIARFSVPALFIIVLSLVAYGTVSASVSASAAVSAAFAVIAASLLVHAFLISHTRTVISKRILHSGTVLVICAVVLTLLAVFFLSPAGALLSMDMLSGSGWTFLMWSAVGIFVIDEVIKLITRVVSK